MLMLVAVMFLSGRLLQLINPAFRFDQPFPWETVVLATAVAFLASWLIVAFHLWFSIRVPSFVASMAVGIVGTVAAVLVIQSDKYGPYYPWTLAGTSAMNALQGKSFTNSVDHRCRRRPDHRPARLLGRFPPRSPVGAAIVVAGCHRWLTLPRMHSRQRCDNSQRCRDKATKSA